MLCKTTFHILVALTFVGFSSNVATQEASEPPPAPWCTVNSDNILHHEFEKDNFTGKIILKIKITDMFRSKAPVDNTPEVSIEPYPWIIRTEHQSEEYDVLWDYDPPHHHFIDPYASDEDKITSGPLPEWRTKEWMEKTMSDIFERAGERQFLETFCKQDLLDEEDRQLSRAETNYEVLEDPYPHPKYETIQGLGEYRFHTKPLDWEDARKVCESEDAHLAILNSQEEAYVLIGLMKRCPRILDDHFNDYAYLGLHDQYNEGKFETVKGEPLEETGYDRWAYNQPDNAHEGLGENCLTMNRAGFYNDIPCYIKLPFFCEAN